ncbi:MAG: B12-binding domain-containing radical SAM protein [Planctomycetes bacterium]|nr:B12-binding domain-containing radical SAM protein [Planctomycetota bacterium]
MRVLFVYPNLYTQMGFNHGLASLSAVLKQAGHETRLLNLNENLPPVPSDEDVWRAVVEWGPGVVGFSCLTQQYRAAVELAHFLRRRAREARRELPPLVVGGVHPTMVPEETMAEGVWDHVGVGECEDALRELVRRIESGDRPTDVANFLSWKDGVRPALAEHAPGAPVAPTAPAAKITSEHWIHNKVGEFPNLETLPIPDYELFDVQRITDQKHGWFGLLSSRGCPYRCTYCLNHKIVDRYHDELGRAVPDLGFFRYRPPHKLVEEIEWVLARYTGIGTFIFDDDLFTQNSTHAIAVADAYRKAKIEVPFVVNSHVKRLDPKVAKALGEAGCKILKLGIESGSPRVRKEVLQRFMSDTDILKTVEAAEQHGLHTSGFLMVGLPYETHEERWETVDLLAKSGIGRFRTSLFFPFPGTESHRLALNGGYIRPEQELKLTDFTESSCLDFGAEENLFIAKLAACMPWFVNSRMDRFRDAPAAKRYQPWVAKVLAMDAEEWARFEPTVRDVDRELAREASLAAELHYSIRYNAFMGVRSDFYLAEEQGVEWYTAAAKPIPERLRALALAAAADEVC